MRMQLEVDCLYAEPVPLKSRKSRATPVKLTPEEKEEKKAIARMRAAVKEKKKEWEEVLQAQGQRFLCSPWRRPRRSTWMTPNREEWLIHQRVVLSSRGTSTSWRNG